MFSRIIKNKNKPTRYTFILAAAFFLLITGIGYIKSNFFDDSRISGDSVTVEDITGTWIQPISGQKDKSQGFTLFKDGSAESVNMNTLLVQKWRLEKGYLILTEKSIGNGNSSTGEEKYKIISAGKKQLNLSRGKSLIEYKKQ